MRSRGVVDISQYNIDLVIMLQKNLNALVIKRKDAKVRKELGGFANHCVIAFSFARW